MMLKRWLRVMMARLVRSACGGPLEQVDPPTKSAPMARQASNTTSTTPPPLVELTSSTNLQALWPRTSSVRRYVVLVSYTQAPQEDGTPRPPRFRAFGVDLSTNSYVFSVDGDRATSLGAFTTAMLDRGVILISTPPGFELAGDCGDGGGTHGSVSRASLDGPAALQDIIDDNIACATDPIEASTPSGSQGSRASGPDWTKFLDIPNGLNNALPDGHFDVLLANPR